MFIDARRVNLAQLSSPSQLHAVVAGALATGRLLRLLPARELPALLRIGVMRTPRAVHLLITIRRARKSGTARVYSCVVSDLNEHARHNSARSLAFASHLACVALETLHLLSAARRHQKTRCSLSDCCLSRANVARRVARNRNRNARSFSFSCSSAVLTHF